MAIASFFSQTMSRIAPLKAGDHLNQMTFHARYLAMPSSFHAELIGGVVFVPSPLSSEHRTYRALVMGWLTNYWIATPGTQARDNATAILGEHSEPQPDGALVITPSAGGQSHISEEGYAIGAPELIVEIASSSASIDLHAKRRDYQNAGVQEYVVVVLRQRKIQWFVLQNGVYHELPADADGIVRSQVFPGLWLHVEALLQLNGTQVMQGLQQGMATAEHRAFVQQLQARQQTS